MYRPHIIKSDILSTLDAYEYMVNELDRCLVFAHIYYTLIYTQFILFSPEQTLTSRSS